MYISSIYRSTYIYLFMGCKYLYIYLGQIWLHCGPLLEVIGTARWQQKYIYLLDTCVFICLWDTCVVSEELTEATDAVAGGAGAAVGAALGLALGGSVAGAVLVAGALAGVVVEPIWFYICKILIREPWGSFLTPPWGQTLTPLGWSYPPGVKTLCSSKHERVFTPGGEQRSEQFP
jgi:hypothetical protein